MPAPIRMRPASGRGQPHVRLEQRVLADLEPPLAERLEHVALHRPARERAPARRTRGGCERGSTAASCARTSATSATTAWHFPRAAASQDSGPNSPMKGAMDPLLDLPGARRSSPSCSLARSCAAGARASRWPWRSLDLDGLGAVNKRSRRGGRHPRCCAPPPRCCTRPCAASTTIARTGADEFSVLLHADRRRARRGLGRALRGHARRMRTQHARPAPLDLLDRRSPTAAEAPHADGGRRARPPPDGGHPDGAQAAPGPRERRLAAARPPPPPSAAAPACASARSPAPRSRPGSCRCTSPPPRPPAPACPARPAGRPPRRPRGRGR